MLDSFKKPQLRGGVSGSQYKPQILDLSNNSVVIGISIGNPEQTGKFLEDTIKLLKLFHQAGKISLFEASGLKAFSIPFTILLNDKPNDRDQKYQQALLEKWESAALITIWQDVQIARDKFLKLKGTKSTSDLLKEAEETNDYVFGLVVRAQQTYDKWLGENAFLNDTYKLKNDVEILTWLDQMQDKTAQTTVCELIELYSANTEHKLTREFEKVVNSSINSVLQRKSIKNIDPKSLIGKLSALYIIEESALLKLWVQNYFMYAGPLNSAMFYILRKYVWPSAHDEEALPKPNHKILEFRLIEAKKPEHILYQKFWDDPENFHKENVIISTTEGLSQPDEHKQNHAKVLKHLTYSINYFLQAIQAAYIPGFALKLIEYIYANFEELESILRILPPISDYPTLDESKNQILDCLEWKIQSVSRLDSNKSLAIVGRVTLFGNKYLEQLSAKEYTGDNVSQIYLSKSGK